MKRYTYLLIITVLLVTAFFLAAAPAQAGSRQMLSPGLTIGRTAFAQEFSRISGQEFIDPAASPAEKISRAREIFARKYSGQETPDAWPKFFLKYVLTPGTEELRARMSELIRWMGSAVFYNADDLDRLAYIEKLSKDLTPFEKILFYEGVYFVRPGSNNLGFGIHTKPYFATLYFYRDRQFAHGSVYDEKNMVQLTFGDDVYRSGLPRIKHVHFYAYMKRLAGTYLRNPHKEFVIPYEQLTNLAMHADENFLPRVLNIYMVKVGGFFPKFRPEEAWKRVMQDEYLSQLKSGMRIKYYDAIDIIWWSWLGRDIPQEAKEYVNRIGAEEKNIKEADHQIIRSRELLSLPADKVKKIWDEKYPVPVSDKVVMDNLGYCSGAVFASRGRVWFRRYGESPDIITAVKKDLRANNADEIFNKDTRVLLLSTSYGAWRWDLEMVKELLVKEGVPENNIEILNSETKPALDGIGVYLFPGGHTLIHLKNHDLGVFESLLYFSGLADLRSPQILDRLELKKLTAEKKQENFTSAGLSRESLSSSVTAPASFRALTQQAI